MDLAMVSQSMRIMSEAMRSIVPMKFDLATAFPRGIQSLDTQGHIATQLMSEERQILDTFHGRIIPTVVL